MTNDQRLRLQAVAAADRMVAALVEFGAFWMPKLAEAGDDPDALLDFIHDMISTEDGEAIIRCLVSLGLFQFAEQAL